jgi:hypothetical protein
MTITFCCLDCGFRISLSLAGPAAADRAVGSLSCGQCRSRRWTSG